MGKMEAALQRIGAVSAFFLFWQHVTHPQTLSNLDQNSLNSFSTALHSVTSDPEIIQIITSHTSPAAVPTLAVAMSRPTYGGTQDAYPGAYESHTQIRGENSAHPAQPPLSPRLHSLPDNVLSPLGLLAEASLQNTDGKRHGRTSFSGQKSTHRPSPLSISDSRSTGRNGTNMVRTGSGYRMATSSVRGGNGDEDEHPEDRGGVASQNYFRPGIVAAMSIGDDRVPELLTIVSREEIGELFEIFFEHSEPHPTSPPR